MNVTGIPPCPLGAFVSDYLTLEFGLSAIKKITETAPPNSLTTLSNYSYKPTRIVQPWPANPTPIPRGVVE